MLHDRGTIKWTSLMLPEHVEMLKEMWQEDAKLERPELDEQEMERMEERLRQAYHGNKSVQLTIYKEDQTFTYAGTIKAINKQDQTIQFMNERSMTNIAFSEIIGVTIL